MQDPTKIESKIITILDAITNGTFDAEARALCLNKISKWLVELESQPEYKDIQVDRWTTYLNSFVSNEDEQSFLQVK